MIIELILASRRWSPFRFVQGKTANQGISLISRSIKVNGKPLIKNTTGDRWGRCTDQNWGEIVKMDDNPRLRLSGQGSVKVFTTQRWKVERTEDLNWSDDYTLQEWHPRNNFTSVSWRIFPPSKAPAHRFELSSSFDTEVARYLWEWNTVQLPRC